MLTGLGLTRDADRVYRAMLAQPQLDVAGLAAALDLAAIQVGDALDLLSELSLVRTSEGVPGIRAVSPDLGLEILLARQSADLAAQQQRLEASRATAAQLISEYADLRPTEASPGVEHLIGIDRIRSRIARLTNEISTEVMAFSPDGAQTAENMEAARPLDLRVLERGVMMRTIYLDSLRNNPPTVDYANWLAAHGGQVRTTATLPTRMIIADRAVAIMPVTSDNTAAGAVVLTGSGTVTALVALFETVWAAARPLSTAPIRDSHGLTPQEAATLALLAQGHTDDSVAKRLGVSPRSARRTATDLLERLGARSRFQAGVRAVQEGLLPGDL
ncbi:helix-turn-helix transcriptional regulator [Streptacidiphilus rugosus]|uniref:helix-turn-helix transcriptional regulator n=1 Tax=Streptacidiphilus rugosus TaxID=405783 RepID=UPI000564B95D|nr:LuxR family transcriptional regulator [Streptacidiphilus rugosus]